MVDSLVKVGQVCKQRLQLDDERAVFQSIRVVSNEFEMHSPNSRESVLLLQFVLSLAVLSVNLSCEQVLEIKHPPCLRVAIKY